MLTLRAARPEDVPAILRFIYELAAFEREADKVLATEADLLRDGWGLDAAGQPLPDSLPRRFEALMAEWEEGDAAPEPVGFALWFASYSTWLGHHGLRLEDLYVTPAMRGRGIGKALLARLASLAVEQGCGRLEWDVLTWNEAAIAVYRRLGASTKDDWHVMRLAGETLTALAEADILRG